MPTLTCPDCGSERALPQLDRTAECFCGHCDYPLFWAPTAGPLGEVGEGRSEEALRRLPGAGGRAMLVSIDCPSCGERNPAANVTCVRCAVALRPEPEPEPEPEPVTEPVVVAPRAPIAAPALPPRPFPWFWVALGVGLALVTILVLLAVL